MKQNKFECKFGLGEMVCLEIDTSESRSVGQIKEISFNDVATVYCIRRLDGSVYTAAEDEIVLAVRRADYP